MDKNYAYITLLTNDDFLTGVKLVKHSLDSVDSKYPLICMVTDAVSYKSITQLERYSIQVRRVPTIEMPEALVKHNNAINPAQADVWKDTFTKYHMFHFTEFDKLIFVDADIYFMKNTDHLFECPHMTAALDGEAFGIWPTWPHFNSGFVVIEPNEIIFTDLLRYISVIDVSTCNGLIADQEVLNNYYHDWPLYDELHLDKYHNLFAPYFIDEYNNITSEDKKDLLNNAVFYHFIGKKPWQDTNRECWGIPEFQFLVPIIDRMLIEEQDLPKICVYTICKNEEQNVESWYKTVQDADAICVIDTGSTDSTWDKLLSCGDNMYIDKYDYEGEFNFSNARNFSLEKARYICNHLDDTAEWVYVTLDLDEFIEPNGINHIRATWKPQYDTMVLHCLEQGLDITKDHKIHSNDKWSWYRTVHEMIKLEYKKRAEWITADVNVICNHIQDVTKKRDYYNLLKKDLLDNPKDVVTLIGLAWEAMDHDDWADVLSYSETASDIITREETNELYQDYQSLMQCYLNCATFWRHFEDYENEELALDAAISIIENEDLPPLRKPYILRALVRTNRGNLEGSLDDYLIAHDIESAPTCWVEEPIYYDNSLLYYQLADLLCMSNNLSEAYRYIELAVQLCPEKKEYVELRNWIKNYI